MLSGGRPLQESFYRGVILTSAMQPGSRRRPALWGRLVEGDDPESDAAAQNRCCYDLHRDGDIPEPVFDLDFVWCPHSPLRRESPAEVVMSVNIRPAGLTVAV